MLKNLSTQLAALGPSLPLAAGLPGCNELLPSENGSQNEVFILWIVMLYYSNGRVTNTHHN